MAGPATAHSFWPSYLQINETAPGEATVDFRIANTTKGVLPLGLQLPIQCDSGQLEVPGHYLPELNFRQERYRLICPEGELIGRSFRVQGLDQAGTDVLVFFRSHDGRDLSQALQAQNPVFTVPAQPAWFTVASSYFSLGSGHVLGGWDHLLFILGLVLLLRRRPKRLFYAITAFTAAHAITLTLATFGMLLVRPAPVEVVIALSIWLLAVELVRPEASRRALSGFFLGLVFTCGLLHGLGFAGTLTDMGLPEGQNLVALAAFNLGVEAGQILFAAAVFTIVILAARMPLQDTLRRMVALAPVYLMGVAGVYWTLERLQAL